MYGMYIINWVHTDQNESFQEETNLFSSKWNDFNHMRNHSVKKWQKNQVLLYVSKKIRVRVNSLRLGDVHIRQWSGSSLVQVMSRNDKKFRYFYMCPKKSEWGLTHWGWVMYIYANGVGHHWFRLCQEMTKNSGTFICVQKNPSEG